MKKYLLIVFSAILTIAEAEETPTRFENGQLLRVDKGKKFTPVTMAGMGDLTYVGFPAFKSWSIKNDGNSTLPLLEAVVISTNTGGPVQNTRLYLEYDGMPPSLLAISDADGRIKMRIQTSMEMLVKGEDDSWKKNGAVRLLRIYIGDPVSEGSNTRVYNVPERVESESNESDIATPRKTSD